MPAYAYRAADRSGAAKKGVIEASSPSAARALLREQALLPLSVEAASERGRSFGSDQAARVSAADRSARARWRRSPARSRRSSARTSRSRKHCGSSPPSPNSRRPARFCSTCAARSWTGAASPPRSAQHPKAFPEFYRASVSAGEASGKLPDVLNHLAEFVENRQANGQKLQLALLYPALLALVSFGMMVMLMVYVVPDIVKVFVSRGADLPLLTRDADRDQLPSCSISGSI
jgi:general secretion pathway protein F